MEYTKKAVIVDNRDNGYVRSVIDEHMKYLPGWDLEWIKDVPIQNGHDYNRYLTSFEFWNRFSEDKILIFQHDSRLLKEIPDEFFEYSYVGAPWKQDAPWSRYDRAGGNGGISIRGVKAHKWILTNHWWNSSKGNEDVFYVHRLENVAPYEVCKRFSVETEFQLGTCAWHAIDKHLSLSECIKIKTQYV